MAWRAGVSRLHVHFKQASTPPSSVVCQKTSTPMLSCVSCAKATTFAAPAAFLCLFFLRLFPHIMFASLQVTPLSTHNVCITPGRATGVQDVWRQHQQPAARGPREHVHVLWSQGHQGIGRGRGAARVLVPKFKLWPHGAMALSFAHHPRHVDAIIAWGPSCMPAWSGAR